MLWVGGFLAKQTRERKRECVCVCVDWGDKVEKKTGNSIGGKKKKKNTFQIWVKCQNQRGGGAEAGSL